MTGQTRKRPLSITAGGRICVPHSAGLSAGTGGELPPGLEPSGETGSE